MKHGQTLRGLPAAAPSFVILGHPDGRPRCSFGEVYRLKNRSWRSRCALALLTCVIPIVVSGCGKTFFFAGRNLPPSGIANRALVAIQNASVTGTGSLEILDAFYDIRHSFNNKTPSFFISGFSGTQPQTIQNMPAEQVGAVYSAGSGSSSSLSLINYAQENMTGTVSGLPASGSSSVFISTDQRYVFSTNPIQHTVTIVDRTLGTIYPLNLPGAFSVSVNPGGSVALVFVQNSNQVYSVYHLQSLQPAPAYAQDCEPQNLPVYCLMPVPGTFDRPTKAVYSSDGSTAYILNCGPECGGTQASVSVLPTPSILIQSGSPGSIPPVPPTGPTQVTATVPVANANTSGITEALVNGSTLYLAGQQLQSDGLLAGVLNVLNTATQKITGTYSISDGTHTKMVLGDNNTLWIGSQRCSQGERFHQSQTGANVQFGCLTMFNTSTNSVTMIDSYKGDATGIAPITSLSKVYTTEGGQVYIYATTDGSTLDNSNVTVVGTASDVAYMDAPTDENNTYY
jgi:hypothetical protein